MDEPKPHPRDKAAPKQDRADRLAEQLRANLMKRKAQARARTSAGTGRTGNDASE